MNFASTAATNPAWPSTRARAPLSLGALAALLLGALVSAPPALAAGGEGLKPGTVAPTFMLPVVNAYKETERRFGPGRWTGRVEQPKKLVILSFFATYCEPCKKEMPELVRLYDAYADQGLGVMLVSIDKGDAERDTVIQLAEENKVKFPVLHDRFQVVARRYDAERLPYMLMLDSDGVVKQVHIGYTEELKQNLENEVRAGLGLPPLGQAEEVAAADGKAQGKGKGKGKGKPQVKKGAAGKPKASSGKAGQGK